MSVYIYILYIYIYIYYIYKMILYIYNYIYLSVCQSGPTGNCKPNQLNEVVQYKTVCVYRTHLHSPNAVYSILYIVIVYSEIDKVLHLYGL